MLDDLTRCDVLPLVDAMVLDLLERGEIASPPVDAIALAQGPLGMIVCLDKEQTQRGRSSRAAGQRHIFLRSEPTEERHQWTVARAIGAHFKPEMLARLGAEAGQTRVPTGESLANLFAQRLLAPDCWFREDARTLDFDVLALKAKYATASHEVLAWRLLDLPDPCIITILDNGVVYRRRSNAWAAKRALSPAEKKCQQFVHTRGQPRRVHEKGWSVQGWPVHQAGWKREILRSVVEE
jgi:Zn-dependent peptidase ImmA (M78 family)